MRLILIILLIISGIIFVGSVLMMSPKGGLGAGIAGFSGGGGDYGSKKSVESKLKVAAYICSVIFVLSSIILPYTA